MNKMAKIRSRTSKTGSKKSSKKTVKTAVARKQPAKKSVSKSPVKAPAVPPVSSPVQPLPSQAFDDSRVFTIEIDSIRAETTIGDLIVAFPRTRDVLMKHGMRFDVEQAGYLYMTLNVFSAIHGLALTGLLEELDVASKEMPLPPLAAPIRPMAPPPAT